MTVIPPSRSLRALVAFASVMAVLFLAGSASAQTYSGRFPRNDTPNTWRRPNGACNGTSPEPATERTFNTLWVSLPASGTWTVTATRQGGGPIAMDFYQPSFLPNGPCVNRWDLTGVEGTNSVSRTFTNCTACTGSTYFFEVVISGAHAADVGNFTLTVSGPANLVSQCGTTGGMSPTVQSAPNSGGTFSANYFTPSGLGCAQAWSVSGVPTWIANFTPSSGSGPRTFTYNVASNSGAARVANINVTTTNGVQTLTVRQAAASCSYALSVNSANPSAAAGNGVSVMTATSGCSWAGYSTATWLSANAGSGNGNLIYSYDANPGPARSAVINAGGQSLTVNQASGCAATVPTTTNVGSGAGGWGVDFTMTSGACPWTASTSESWITVLDTSGYGNGTVDFNYAANIGPARSGTITIAGRTHTVNQAAGCVSSLPATSANVGAAASTPSATVNMNVGTCDWTATSNASWLMLLNTSGTGNGTVNYNVAANTGPARSGTLTIAGRTFTVNQASGCTGTLSANSGAALASGDIRNITLTMSNSLCPWTSTTAVPWITGVPASGTGSRSFAYTVAPNPGLARTGTFTIAGNTYTVNQSNGCASSLPSSSGAVGAGAGSSTAAITMTDGACPWSASTTTPWISLTTSSGTGSGNAAFAVSANPGLARSGTITLGGNTYTVNQASGCSATIAPTSAAPGSAGGASSFGITMTDGACPWTASTTDSWITGVTTNGTGSATVSYTVAANTGPARTGTITAGGRTFTVTQGDGCTASLVSGSASPGAAGGAATAGLVMSNAACTWTASTSTPWITGVTANGSGSTSVAYTVAPNPGLARTGTITIAGQTFTVNQANGCTTTLPSSGASIGAGTGTNSAAITLSDAACPWTASTSTPWLSAVTASGTGSGTVSFTAAANPGLLRTGTITMGGQTFTVTQANGCTAMLTASGATPGPSGGAANVGITMSDAACPWSAATATPWITGVTASGAGTSTVSYSVAANTGPARSGSITIGGISFAVNQGSGCTVSLTPMSASLGAAAGTTSFAVNTDAGCGWSAASLQPWVTSVTPSGVGPGMVTVGYVANPGLVRSGSVTVLSTTTTSEAEFTFMQANGCVASIDPTSTSVGAGGTSGSVALTMSDAACPFSVSSNQAFATPLVTSGVGSTTVGFSVAANVGPARSATLTVAGLAFSISQASGCSITLTPSNASVHPASGTTSFSVVTAAGCGYTTSEAIAWVTSVTPSGTGPGTVSVGYTANVSVPRDGAIRVTSTDTGVTADFTLEQGDGCTASLGNSTESVGSGATSESVVLTLSDSACPFTVSAGAAWLTPGVASGNGTTTVGYDVATNTGPERTATITLATETLTVTQASGCTIDITPASASVSQAAGTATFDVTTDVGCVYDVTHATPWLASVPTSGTGPGTFAFGYQANTGIERSGSVTVTTDTGDFETFGVTQGDGCVVSLATSAADVTEAGGTSDFVVTMGTGCTYDASSSAAWLTATVSATGVTYTVDAWDGAPRSAEITVTSGTSASIETFVVTQASGCVVMLTPGSATVSGAGDRVSFTVTSGDGCTFAATSEDEFISDITIAGDTVTFRVGENGRMTRMGSVLVTSNDTDSEGTFVVQQGEGDGRPGDGGVAVGVVPVGDGCSTAPGTRGGSGAFVGLLLLLGLAIRRRARAGVVAVALLALPTVTSAQAFEEGYDLEALRPASSARVDYVSVESGESRLAGWFELGATLGYDALPLVVRASNGEDTRAVAGQGWLRLGGAFAIGQRFRLGVQMPFVLARHGDMAVLPDYPDVDRPAFGDLALVPKLTLLTREPDAGSAFGQGFSLAVLVPLTLPTGQAGRLAGEDVTVEPRVALDYATARGFGGALNVGFRIREARAVLGNQLDEAVTLGLAGRVPLVTNRLFAVAEVVTDIAVRTPSTRNASRGEVLASLRYANDNIVASGGVGAGFLGGLATPRFRVYASLTYAPTHGRSETETEPQPEPVETETQPEPESQVAVAEPQTEPEPEPQVADPVPQPEQDPEPQVAEAQPELDRCEANPAASGCGVQTLCGTADMHALRDEAGLVTVSGFAVDSAELPPGSDADVARIAERLLANPDLEQVIVVGHADPSGSRAHNAALTRRRAQRVRDALVQAGVPRRRLVLRAVGSVCSEPPDDQASNRRVEFLVVQ